MAIWEPFDFGGAQWLRYDSGDVTAMMRDQPPQRQYRIVSGSRIYYYGTAALSAERTKRVLEILVAIASAETTSPLGIAPQRWETDDEWAVRTTGAYKAFAKEETRTSGTVAVVFRVIEVVSATRGAVALIGTSDLPFEEVKRGLDGALSICVARRTTEIPVLKADD